MLLGQRLQIKPNKHQREVFEKAFGIKRYTYNWALSKWKSLKAQGVQSVKINDLKKEWNHTKPVWVYEAPKDANQQPFKDLQKALSNYFTAKKKGLHTFHFPKFKTKNKGKNSFYVSNTYIHLTNNIVHIPKTGKMPIIGHLQYHLRDIKILSYTISKTADKYYLNEMHDGTKAQEDALKKAKKNNFLTWRSTFNDKKEYLESIDLFTVQYCGKKFNYGSSLIYRAIPANDLKEIKDFLF